MKLKLSEIKPGMHIKVTTYNEHGQVHLQHEGIVTHVVPPFKQDPRPRGYGGDPERDTLIKLDKTSGVGRVSWYYKAPEWNHGERVWELLDKTEVLPLKVGATVKITDVTEGVVSYIEPDGRRFKMRDRPGTFNVHGVGNRSLDPALWTRTIEVTKAAPEPEWQEGDMVLYTGLSRAYVLKRNAHGGWDSADNPNDIGSDHHMVMCVKAGKIVPLIKLGKLQ